MRFHYLYILKLGSRRSNQIVRDRDNHFSDDCEPAVDEQVERPVHRACQTVFDGRKNVIRRAVANRRERSLERRPGHECDPFAEQLNGCLFAESAAFSLKCYPRMGRNFHERAFFPRAFARLAFGSSARPQP